MGLPLADIDHDQQELVTTQPHRVVSRSDRTAQKLSDKAQHVVACFVPPRVVMGLEVVDVDHHDGKVLVPLALLAHYCFQLTLQESAVLQTRQWIDGRTILRTAELAVETDFAVEDLPLRVSLDAPAFSLPLRERLKQLVKLPGKPAPLAATAELKHKAMEVARQVVGNDARKVKGNKERWMDDVGASWRGMYDNEANARMGKLSPTSVEEGFKEFLDRKGRR